MAAGTVQVDLVGLVEAADMGRVQALRCSPVLFFLPWAMRPWQ